MSRGKVAFGYCVSGVPMVHLDWHLSVAKLRGVDTTMCVRGGSIVSNRNDLVRLFLDDLPAEFEWLVMSDVDGTFEPDIIERLLDCEQPLVGALAFAGSPGVSMYPTIYVIIKDDTGRRLVHVPNYPPDELIPVHATGAHFLMVHRGVLVEMRKRFDRTAMPWFAEGDMEGPDGAVRYVGEDVTFCMRAGMVGVTPHVHTGIQTGHLKMTTLQAWQYEAMNAGVALPDDPFPIGESPLVVPTTDQVMAANREQRRALVRAGAVPR